MPVSLKIPGRARPRSACTPAILLLLLLSLSFGSISIRAQSTAASKDAAGSIMGRIKHDITGQNLANARISIKGTDLSTRSDAFGQFRLAGVPEGPVVLSVRHTGLDEREIYLTVPRSGTVEQEIALRDAQDVTRLDSFVVSESRTMAGEAIALNERRVSANIKNVVTADGYGDVMGGNIAEMLQYIPGITTGDETVAAEVHIRGLPGNLVNVTVDGGQVASANELRNGSGTDRTVGFNQLSIIDVSRVEVAKVPLPSSPADSMAGSINMVTKSVFEREKAELRYRVYLSANSDHLSLDKTPHPFGKANRKVKPNFDFDYTLPLSSRFGIVVTGMSSGQYTQRSDVTTRWNATGTATNASPANPFLQSITLQDTPRSYYKNAVGLKADWKVTPNSVLSFGSRLNNYLNEEATHNFTADAGTNANPNPTTGTRFSYSPTSTSGATGRGAVTSTTNYRHIPSISHTQDARYRYDSGTWWLYASISYSESKVRQRSAPYGHFNGLMTSMPTPVRVNLDNVTASGPSALRVFDNNNVAIDPFDANSFQLTGTSAETSYNIDETIPVADLQIRRNLRVFGVPTAIEIGGMRRQLERDSTRDAISYAYRGVNGNTRAGPYTSTHYPGDQNSNLGFTNLPWASPVLAFQAWERDPGLFFRDPARAASDARLRLTQSFALEETVSALYAQIDVRMLKDRLRVLGGVRQEKTDLEGVGPYYDPNAVYQRNPDGSYVRDSRGARVRRPEAGAAGSVEQEYLMRKERGYQASKSYDGSYPSIHLTYSVTPDIVVKAAYAATYGRPNISNVLPNVTINENDPETNPAIPGIITINNTALQPWTADNFDVMVEYYGKDNSQISVGAFRKDIDGFFADEQRIAETADLDELGLSSEYLGWQLRTEYNSTNSAQVSGIEASAQGSLQFFGNWGRRVTLFVNATRLKLEGDSEVNFTSFVPRVLNWGITYSKNPVTLRLRWNHRGDVRTSLLTALGPDVYQYNAARTLLDLNFNWQLNRRLGLFLNGRNVTNRHTNVLAYGSVTPEYAQRRVERSQGSQWDLGLRGSF